MNPYDKAHELARALRDSQEFINLQDKKRRVDAEPVAKKMLDDFRHRQWELETRRIMGEEITDEDLKQMSQMNEAIQMHATVREYLEAEYRFGVIYSDIHKILGEAVREVISQPEGV
ncbi:MAG: YlbF family regulator [Tumebacillaceae bacterium]